MGFEFGHLVHLRRRQKQALPMVRLRTLTKLYSSYICSAFDVYLTLVYIAHREDPSTKLHVEVVIIHTIYQVSKLILYCTSILIQNHFAVIGHCLNSPADCAHSK